MAFSLRVLALLLSICLLTSCGLKGSLYYSEAQEKRAAEKQAQRAAEQQALDPQEEADSSDNSTLPTQPAPQ